MMKKTLYLIIILSLFFSSNLKAEVLKKLEIKGNSRISEETLKVYGEIQINGVKYDIDLPHGGIGQSGIGHDCSSLALQDYLIQKRITCSNNTYELGKAIS